MDLRAEITAAHYMHQGPMLDGGHLSRGQQGPTRSSPPATSAFLEPRCHLEGKEAKEEEGPSSELMEQLPPKGNFYTRREVTELLAKLSLSFC